MSASWRIIEGDCREAMAVMPEASVDAIVTDPPYGLEFMGKGWDAPWKVGERGDDADFVATGYTDGAERLPRPTFTGAPNTSCGNCGGSRRGRESEKGPRRCRCDAPSFPNIAAIQGRAFQQWCEAWAREALRVLKPGGHMLVFGGTRTYHRLTCGIEDAGFEVRDCLAWLYASGFPKSLDVGKAIDKAAGAEREVIGTKLGRPGMALDGGNQAFRQWREAEGREDAPTSPIDVTAPATPEAQRWQGWGTALKPAHEPIVVGRKPLAGTVAGNVTAFGTGAINVDGCRIESGQDHRDKCESVVGLDSNRNGAAYGEWKGERESSWSPAGRWPANVVLDEEAAAMLDEQTGERRSAGEYTKGSRGGPNDFQGPASINIDGLTAAQYDDVGGASRFFYVAKADGAERNAGLSVASLFTPDDAPERNDHPTVKPIDLMRWLVRLVTPPGGTVLDPFAGSGTTGCAAMLEGFGFVGIEGQAQYAAIARARLTHWSSGARERAA